MKYFKVLLVLMVVIVNLSYVWSGGDTFIPSESNSQSGSEFSSPTSSSLSLPSSSPSPDRCPNPIDLKDSNGNVLRRLCYITEGMNWFQSRQRCLSIGYTMFRIDNAIVEKAFADYLASVGAGRGSSYWLNGIGNADGKWSLVDPDGPFTYLTSPAAAEGKCFFYIYFGINNNAYQIQARNCATQISFTWCERA